MIYNIVFYYSKIILSIKIISFSILNNQKYVRVIFENILNSMCYLTLFIGLSWDKVYYIYKKKGNDPKIYFKISKRYKKCFVHKTYNCGCTLEEDNDNLESDIEKYIFFYKFCSLLFVKEGGKIQYVNMESKINVINTQ